MIKQYGFQKPHIDETHYKSFGGFISLPAIVIQPDGNWRPFLPKYERQFGTGWDSYGCTVFGTLNCLETLLKHKFNMGYDFSERYIYNLAEVEPPGHDPHDIAEKIRKEGVIEQELLPFVDSYDEFRKPRPMTKDLIDKGHLWLAKYNFKHEWLYDEDLKDLSKRHQLIRENLPCGPLGGSVTAWILNNDGEYSSNGQPNTHWVEIFAIDEQDRVQIFDSYDQSIKLLSADHDIQFVKRYVLEEKTPEEQLNSLQKNLIEKLYEFALRLFRQVYKVSGEFVVGVFSERDNN